MEMIGIDQNTVTGTMTDGGRIMKGTVMNKFMLWTMTGEEVKDGTRKCKGTTTTREIGITKGEISDKMSFGS